MFDFGMYTQVSDCLLLLLLFLMQTTQLHLITPFVWLAIVCSCFNTITSLEEEI